MDLFLYVKVVAIIFTGLLIIYFFSKFFPEKLSFKDQSKIALIGVISNFLDTIGIGSFAVIIAMRKMFNVMEDDVKLIGTMNIQAAITSLAQMLIFLHFVKVDFITVLVGIVMIAVGGLLSGLIAVRIDKRIVHKIMLWAFIITGALLLLIQLRVFNFPASNEYVSGYKLIVFAFFMLIAGMLPAFGVGYYSIVEATMFLFGLKSIVAFPIMTAASSYQMPLTSATFINKGKFYGKSTIIMSLFGVLGVFAAAMLITNVNSYVLKWILLAIIVYNIFIFAKVQK